MSELGDLEHIWKLMCVKCWDAVTVGGWLSRAEAEIHFDSRGYRKRDDGKWVCEGCDQEHILAEKEKEKANE